jgi:hypothetical protein
MKARTAARLAWAAAAFPATVQLVALALLLLSLASPVFLPAAVELTSGTPVAFVGFLAYPMVGGLIAARRPGNPVGWLLLAFSAGVALTNVIYLYAVYGLVVSSVPLPGAETAAWADAWVWIIPLCSLPVVLLLYPGGRVASPGWRWPLRLCFAPAVLAAGIGVALWGESGRQILLGEELPSREARVLEAIVLPFLLVLVLVGVAALVVRFRMGAWEERQQIKWVVLSSAYLVLSGALAVAAPQLFPPLAGEFLSTLGFMSVPLAIAIAILRYRLYDIDRIINRTLVYGSLTIILALVYVTAIVGAGTLLQEVTGDHRNNLIVVASTIAVAGLFRPARARVQAFIDRRFYRRKYDAARTLEAFSIRLRDDVDLESLESDLIHVVRNTMQPAHVSVWLRT